ncbi:hypothetical protein EJ08DRAFT_245237 [Tothia fuscella]|uniref:Uncharacterized protein n=1 Tax=Tothia fuscella TaxID=1048955 RepID=A0A9P4TYT9_9PEZI|nr:hypothetical protein EJ08DRAFT_245237 [Tothia fuscella]
MNVNARKVKQAVSLQNRFSNNNSNTSYTPLATLPTPPAVQNAKTFHALDPYAREAISYTCDPNNVNPPGKNGIDLQGPKPRQTPLLTPPDCDFDAVRKWMSEVDTKDVRKHAYFGRHLAAYRFDCGDPFSLQPIANRTRSLKIEDRWSRGVKTMDIETAYWSACMERQHDPQLFHQRDNYLKLENAIEFAGKIVLHGTSEQDIALEIYDRCMENAYGIGSPLAVEVLLGLTFAVTQNDQILIQQAEREPNPANMLAATGLNDSQSCNNTSTLHRQWQDAQWDNLDSIFLKRYTPDDDMDSEELLDGQSESSTKRRR